MNRSDIGKALAELSRGIKKTMSPAAIKQRQEAAKSSAIKRKGRKQCENVSDVKNESR